MERETALLNQLTERFPELHGEVTRARRIFVDVPLAGFPEIVRFCKDELQFPHLCTITGLDAGDAFEFIYHIANDEGIVLNLKLKTPRENTLIPSVMPVYQGSEFYELELEGLLGICVEGLPNDRQYPLPDNWPKGQYPLRKDWKPEPVRREP